MDQGYRDMLNLSNMMAMQGLRDIAAERQARRTAQVEQNVDSFEKSMWDANRSPVRVTETIEPGSPLHDLVSRAVYMALDYGVPRECMPTFTADEENFEKSHRPAAAEYEAERGMVYISPSSHPFSSSPAFESYEKSEEGEGLPEARPTAIKMLVHEIGHHMRAVRLGADYRRPYEPYPGFQEIAKRVSEYAAVNHHEFCAEVFVGLVSGRKLDHQVMAMYRHFGGWERPEPLVDRFAKFSAPLGTKDHEEAQKTTSESFLRGLIQELRDNQKGETR